MDHSYIATVANKLDPSPLPIRLMAAARSPKRPGSCMGRNISASSGDTDPPTPTPTPTPQDSRTTPTPPDPVNSQPKKKDSDSDSEPAPPLLRDAHASQLTLGGRWQRAPAVSSAVKPALLSNNTCCPDCASTSEELLTIATTGPSACSASDSAPASDLRSHSVHRPQLRFDPVARIIPHPDEENSSDDEHPARRSRSQPRKRPVRLCTKKVALPLNISTSSLIGIGYHANHSTASLTPSSPPASVSSRELYAQTRREIDEDAQFIPDAPRFLNLTLPAITRQPDRRALRLEEEHRLERWRKMGGGGKTNLKPSQFSNLSHLSPGLRDRLTSAAVPVQLSTNTAINSIPSSVSPEDLLLCLDTQTAPPSKEIQTTDTYALLGQSGAVHPLAPSSSIISPEPHQAQLPNSAVGHTGSFESGEPFLLSSSKSSRFGWLGQRARSIMQRTGARDHQKTATVPPAASTGDAPGAPLRKSPTPAWFYRPSPQMSPDTSLEGAPLKRVSTPRGPIPDTPPSGVPLHRTATPATSIQRPAGTPLQHSCTPGALLEQRSPPGAALQRSATTGTLLNKPKHVVFFQKLAIWRKKPPPSNQTQPSTSLAMGTEPSTSLAPDLDNDLIITSNSTSHPLRGRPIGKLADPDLILETNGKASTPDKWGSRKEVPLRECCKICLSAASVEASSSQEIRFSPGALKHHHGKNWILQDTLRQGGIPSQQIKLISAELGPPYTSWVAKTSIPDACHKNSLF